MTIDIEHFEITEPTKSIKYTSKASANQITEEEMMPKPEKSWTERMQEAGEKNGRYALMIEGWTKVQTNPNMSLREFLMSVDL